MSNLTLNVETADKKYTVVQWSDGKLEALRYGEAWRDCVGDGLVLALAQDLEATRAENARLVADHATLNLRCAELETENAKLRDRILKATNALGGPHDNPWRAIDKAYAELTKP